MGETMNQYEMIGFDLDGTLLNSKKILTDKTKQVMEEAISRGIILLPATGRPIHGIPKEIVHFKGINYAITANGARIYDLETNKVLYENLVPWEKALDVLQLFQKYDTLCEIYLEGIGYVEQDKMEHLSLYMKNPAMHTYMKKTKRRAKDLAVLLLDRKIGVDKIHALFASQTQRHDAMKELENLEGITVSTALENNIEVNQAGVDKGKGLLRLGEILCIPPEKIMALGDGSNDLAMMKAAGLGVAMKNGLEEVKLAADVVTDTNDEEGAAKAILKYALKYS